MDPAPANHAARLWGSVGVEKIYGRFGLQAVTFFALYRSLNRPFTVDAPLEQGFRQQFAQGND
jgi:hypothetical protein